MFCHNCGAEIKENLAFCPACGSGTQAPTEETNFVSVAKNAHQSLPTCSPGTSRKNSRLNWTLVKTILGGIGTLLAIVLVIWASTWNEQKKQEATNPSGIALYSHSSTSSTSSILSSSSSQASSSSAQLLESKTYDALTAGEHISSKADTHLSDNVQHYDLLKQYGWYNTWYDEYTGDQLEITENKFGDFTYEILSEKEDSELITIEFKVFDDNSSYLQQAIINLNEGRMMLYFYNDAWGGYSAGSGYLLNPPTVSQETEPYTTDSFCDTVWQCILPGNGEEFFIYQISFYSDESVEYMVGWLNSDIANIYKGTFSVSEDTLTVNLVSDWDYSSINSTYAFTVYEGQLALTLVEGDPLIPQRIGGDILAFDVVF